MLGKWLKKKLGKQAEVPATEQFYTPLRIALHSTLKVSTVDLIGLSSHKEFTTPNGDLDVVSIATVDNDPDTIYRVMCYDQDETVYVIQLHAIYDPRNDKAEVNEVMFFKIVDHYEPLDYDEWHKRYQKMRERTYTYGDVEFDRIWGEEVDKAIDLFGFEEKSVGLAGESTTEVSQMLFGRELGDVDEFLLTSAERDDNMDAIIHFVGYVLPAQAVQVQ
jgi:hypothetical protein